MPRPRILHIIDNLDYGAPRVMLRICKALADRYEHEVCAYTGGNSEAPLEESHIPCRILLQAQEGLPRLRKSLWDIFHLARRHIAEVRPDIVHCHGGASNISGRLAASLRGIPSLAHLHVVEPLWHDLPGRFLYRLTQRGQMRIIAVSNGVAQDFHEATGLSPITIYNAVDETRLVPETTPRGSLRKELVLRDDTLLVGTLAGFRKHKNYPTFLRCAQLVCQQRPDVRFACAGDGPLFVAMRDLRDELGLSERVRFLGFRGDVASMLRDFDVFVLTSDVEGLPLVLVEAMLMRCPIVATDVVGSNEVVEDQKTGFLVPPGNDQAAAESVLRLCDGPALRQRMGQAARARAIERFGLATFANAIDQVYQGLLQR